MASLVVHYRDGQNIRWGILVGTAPTSADTTIDVRPIQSPAATTADVIVAHELRDLKTENSPTVTIPATSLLSPITNDAALICQGLNYADHAAEAQHHVRKQNLWFAKANSAISGAYDPIVRPREVQLLDYEVEFGIVLRKPVHGPVTVSEADIGSYVAGVFLANDVSARDVMFGAPFLQWFQGKSYRTFCPMGPVLYLLERDEVAKVLANLEIKLWVNGELRQSAKSTQLIFGPTETIGQISSVIDLERGDVVLTGTPGGVTSPATPKLIEILKTHLLADTIRRDELRAEMVKARPFLKPGDVVTASLRDLAAELSLGGLKNQIVEA